MSNDLDEAVCWTGRGGNWRWIVPLCVAVWMVGVPTLNWLLR